MNFIAWIISAATIGWLASLLMKSDTPLASNLIVGIFGSAIGHWILEPLTSGILNSGVISREDFVPRPELGMSSALATFFGALALLAILNLVRKGRMR